MSRSAAVAAMEKIVRKAAEESRRLDDTPVFVFKIQVDTVTFDGAELAKTRGLRFALAVKKDQEAQEADNTHANRILQTPSIKPIVEGPEADQGGKERQQCVFNVRHEADVLWEGDETVVLSACRPGFFFSTLVGSCDLPLALCFEQLVSSVRSCNPTEAEPLPIELELQCGSSQLSGRCCIFVSCWKESLGAVGGRRALRFTTPEVPPEGHRKIHSDVIKHKMKEIDDCHSLNDKLQKAQADLWMHGVQRLTTEGALDSKTLKMAETCGLVSTERAKMLRQKKKAPPKLSARSCSFTSVERDGGTTWLRLTTI